MKMSQQRLTLGEVTVTVEHLHYVRDINWGHPWND